MDQAVAVAGPPFVPPPDRPPMPASFRADGREVGPLITISFTIEKRFAPALRSAIDEISNEVGGRLEGSHSFATELALTDAVISLGALRAAINEIVPHADPFYR